VANAVLDPRLLGLRGESAHAPRVRERRAGTDDRRVPQRGRRDQGARHRGRDRARPGRQPRLAGRVVLHDGQPRVRIEGRTHDLCDDLSGGHSEVRFQQLHQSDTRRVEGCDAFQRQRQPDRARSAASRVGRRQRPERPDRSADRRPRLARDPLLRLRHAPGGADADRDRNRLDPQHLQPRLGADLPHERLDHRAVPDRAGRARSRDRLRAADDLPLPRPNCARARTSRPRSSRR
jgi:hypothetical protein